MVVYKMILRRIGMILTKEQVIEEISKEIDLDISLLQYDNDIVKKIQSIDNIGFFSFESFFNHKQNEKVIKIEYEYKNNNNFSMGNLITEEIEITEKKIFHSLRISSEIDRRI